MTKLVYYNILCKNNNNNESVTVSLKVAPDPASNGRPARKQGPDQGSGRSG